MSKELPVIYALIDNNGDLVVYHSACAYGHVMCVAETTEQLRGSSFCGDRVEYRSVIHCRDCVNFTPVTFSDGSKNGDCDDFCGLPRPKADGSDFCPYGKRKETK